VIFTRDLGLFYKLNHREMVALAGRTLHTRDMDYAEDVVQAWYLKAHRSHLLDKYDSRYDLGLWLCRSLRWCKKGGTPFAVSLPKHVHRLCQIPLEDQYLPAIDPSIEDSEAVYPADRL
jgi:hypothetical protein